MNPSPPQIVLATRNAGKLAEIREILSDLPVEWVSLQNYPDCPEVAEDGSTYLENARQKARIIAAHCQAWALADDSGLEVETLDWEPGVYSARYAGEPGDDAKNNQKLLRELAGIPEEGRRAVFRCTMVLAHPDGREFVTTGELWGEISFQVRGEKGFGYDPLFLLPETGRTLAELGPTEKNRISHRTLALAKLRDVIKKSFDFV